MTEEEARAILDEVEPTHAVRERKNHRSARTMACVVVPLAEWEVARGAERVQGWVSRTFWRPRATRTPSGWAVSGGWLDEPVPPLPTRGVPNAGGVRPVVAWSDDDGVRESVRDRSPGVLFASHVKTVASALSTKTCVDVVWFPPPQGSYTLSDEALVVGVKRETRTAWHRERVTTRAVPTLDLARGWCAGLDAGFAAEQQPGTKSGWSVMVRALRAFMRETDAAWAAERDELTQRTEAA